MATGANNGRTNSSSTHVKTPSMSLAFQYQCPKWALSQKRSKRRRQYFQSFFQSRHSDSSHAHKLIKTFCFWNKEGVVISPVMRKQRQRSHELPSEHLISSCLRLKTKTHAAKSDKPPKLLIMTTVALCGAFENFWSFLPFELDASRMTIFVWIHKFTRITTQHKMKNEIVAQPRVNARLINCHEVC